ncbi:MAG: hypothetical protein GXY36_14480 [Chloroflexi bacterium]|nr:hypothetical protein [Chloroflexota bacterium]
MFKDDTTLFWLIHLFLGIVLPFLIYESCCSPKALEKKQQGDTGQSNNPLNPPS